MDSEEHISPDTPSQVPTGTAERSRKPKLPPQTIAEAEYFNLQSEYPELRLAAFEKLFDAYAEQEVQRVAKKFRGLPEDMVVDAVYNAFLALWNEVSKWGWDERWHWGYLRKIANNLAFRAHSKMVFRSQFVVMLSEDESGGDGAADSSDLEDFAAKRNPAITATDDDGIRLFADNNELMARVNDAIEGFSPRLQKVGRILAANWHLKIGPETLLVLYFDAHREMLTIDAATKALGAVRSKLAEVLVRYRRQSDPK